MIKQKGIAYQHLSFIYRHIMRKVNYIKWAEYLYTISKKNIKHDAKVLELAGGNCSLSNYFKTFYPDIIVSDISKYMLFSARDLPRGKADNHLKKVCCDMTQLPFKMKFDLIYCTFDSINYLTNKKSLLKLFKEVKTVLSDKGIFTFDVCLERNSIKHSEEPLRKGHYNKIHFIHKSLYNKETRIHKNFFELKFNGETITEVHRQKIYPFNLYFNILEKAGLFVVNCFDAFTFKPGKENSERVQFVIKKVG